MKKQLIMGLALYVAAMILVLLTSSANTADAADLTLTANMVKEIPAGPDAPAWQKAKAIQIPFVGKEQF
ncbi:MAG: hypothetical protein WC836_00345, partial [Desulfobacula sp.]